MYPIYNFSAGPAALPTAVMQQIQAELLEYGNSKASVMEISHRGVDFMQLAQTLEQDLRDLLNVTDEYKVLFLQGGSAAQFAMLPINLLRGKKCANYANTGHWSAKAIVEAKRYCDVCICTDSKHNNYTNIDDFYNWNINSHAAYLHYTSNETIAGLEFDYVPKVDGMPIVADMSSNILSQPIDVSKFGLIYASAQKNIGIAGLTMVIIKQDLIGEVVHKQPNCFNYETWANSDSMYNTPATFSWYVASCVLKWLKNKGGLYSIADINKRKAKILYDAIDSSDFYNNRVNTRYRSLMNVPFTLADSSLDELFLRQALTRNLLALKAHVAAGGGMRASIYNSMPEEGVLALVDFMREFERHHA